MFHKKAFRRYLACLLVVCSLLSLSAIAASPIEGRLETVTTQVARESAEDFLNSQIDEQAGYEIVSQKALYGANDLVLAYCYFLRPEGYVIVDTNGMVTEAAFEATASYRALQAATEKIYYTGALSYYVKSNENYRDIVSQETVSAEAVAFALATHRKMVQSNAVKATAILQERRNSVTRALAENTYINGSLRKYSYNPNGICASTATAILLMYYRDYKDSWMVPSWHVTDTGESLIKLLVPQINGDPPQAATIVDIKLGLEWYFRWRGISDEYQALLRVNDNSESNYSWMHSMMLSSRPVIVAFREGPMEKHGVVAHGVQVRAFGNGSYSYHLFVGDGWGHNDVLVSMNYAHEFAYIAP